MPAVRRWYCCDGGQDGASKLLPDSTTHLQPVLSLEINDVSIDALRDGSEAHELVFEQAAAELSSAIGIRPGNITVFGNSSESRVDGQCRRQMQTATVIIEFEIASTMAATVIAFSNGKK